MSWTNNQVKEAVSKVTEKASTDAKFRKLALSDVHAAVQEVTGKEVPKEFKINVVDGTGYHVTVVLPEVRDEADELSENELEAVAGGVKDPAIPNILVEPSPGPIHFPPPPTRHPGGF